jgi:hypothetical protein
MSDVGCRMSDVGCRVVGRHLGAGSCHRSRSGSCPAASRQGGASGRAALCCAGTTTGPLPHRCATIPELPKSSMAPVRPFGSGAEPEANSRAYRLPLRRDMAGGATRASTVMDRPRYTSVGFFASGPHPNRYGSAPTPGE